MDMAGTRYWNWNLLLAVVADHDDDEPTQSRICVQKFPFQWRNFTSLKLQLHRQRTLLYVCRYLVKRDVVDDYMVGSVVNECKKYRVAGVKSFPTYLLNHPGKSHGGVSSFFLEYIHSCTCRVRAADVAKEKDRPTAYTVPELSVLSLCATFRNSSRDVSCTLAYTF